MRAIMPLARTEYHPFSLLNQALDFFEEPKATVMNPCEWSVKDDHYFFRMDVPGVTKEDIDIEVLDSQLRISGERRSLIEDEEYSQKGYGRFERTIKLSSGIDTTGIAAHCEDGVLTVALPKKKKSQANKVPIFDGTNKDEFLSKTKKIKDKS